jgi:hypothetical protein
MLLLFQLLISGLRLCTKKPEHAAAHSGYKESIYFFYQSIDANILNNI